MTKADTEQALEADSVLIGELLLLSAQRRISWSGNDLTLSNAEFNLLEVLIQKAAHVVSKDFLSEQGLGLAIASQIIENHHGRVDAVNRAEGGLRLSVTPPKAACAIAPD